MENNCYVGVGSNIDDRISYIDAAVNQLDNHPACTVTKISSVYETKPYGKTDQNNFLNCVLKLETGLSLKELFDFTKQIEINLGRQKRERWGPREIDLDILFFNDLVYSDEHINIPHEDVLNRDFVLVPLAEIEPGLVHPVVNERVSDIKLSDLENNIINKLDFQFT